MDKKKFIQENESLRNLDVAENTAQQEQRQYDEDVVFTLDDAEINVPDLSANGIVNGVILQEVLSRKSALNRFLRQ